MNRSEILEKVKGSICRAINLDQETTEINDDASLYDDLGIDSVDSIDLVVELEETFQIKLPTGDLSYLVRVNTIVDEIERLQKDRD